MSKLDLIIPTHNRTEYLKRILDYYQKCGKEFNIIVADSSKPAIKEKNKKLVNSYSDLRILYIDKFPQNIVQSYKFAEMVKYAKSKYICFCADDDFIVPNAIITSIDFLEKNSDYIGAHGTYIGFYLFKSIISNKFWWQYRYSPISISSNDPLDRLVTLLTSSSQILWAVKRRDAVIDSYKQFNKMYFDPSLIAVLGELVPDSLAVLQGKIKNLDIFYSARQYYGSVISYYPNFQDAQSKGIYYTEYIKFRNCLLSNLPTANPSIIEKSINTIDFAMNKYVNSSQQQYFINKILFVLRYFPKSFSKVILMLNAYYLTSKDKKSNIGLIEKPTSKFYHDFEAIRQSVLTSNI